MASALLRVAVENAGDADPLAVGAAAARDRRSAARVWRCGRAPRRRGAAGRDRGGLRHRGLGGARGDEPSPGGACVRRGRRRSRLGARRRQPVARRGCAVRNRADATSPGRGGDAYDDRDRSRSSSSTPRSPCSRASAQRATSKLRRRFGIGSATRRSGIRFDARSCSPTSSTPRGWSPRWATKRWSTVLRAHDRTIRDLLASPRRIRGEATRRW